MDRYLSVFFFFSRHGILILFSIYKFEYLAGIIRLSFVCSDPLYITSNAIVYAQIVLAYVYGQTIRIWSKYSYVPKHIHFLVLI